MGRAYRDWAERRHIICAAIAETNPNPLETFQLTSSEKVYYRARAAKAVDALTRKTSAFKAYYALPKARPFGYVVGLSALIVVGAIAAATYIWLTNTVGPQAYPLFAACATLAVAAIGWAVAGWITHRNTIRQNTNTILFARFSQAPFVEALHRFNMAFGNDVAKKVTSERLAELRSTENEDDRKAATSAGYLLNYYEFIAAGVLHGDLNYAIVSDNIRSTICFFHDKCLPYIEHLNNQNPRIFENLIKMRTHYRDV